MQSRLFWMPIVGLTLGVSACRAEDVRPAGEVPVSLSLWVKATRAADITLRVSAETLSEQGTTGAVRIRLPGSVALLSGDTTFTVPARRILPPSILRLRALRSGSHEIRATLVAGPPSSNDLVEVRLPLATQADTLLPGTSELVRTEAIRAGQRYRYAGLWLVPIGEDEEFSNSEFSRTGAKPAPLSPITAKCPECSELPDTVTFVAVIDRSGKVIQAHPLGTGVEGGAKVRAAAEAISKARFKPAQCGDKAVTDWVHVPVAVFRTQ